jgi:excisionase family DNA binding protein
MIHDHLLTAQQVADYAQVKRRQILEAARKGELESITVGRGTKRPRRRFTPEAVDRWLWSITDTKEPKIL